MRETEDLPKVWQPPTSLETPVPPDGVGYRWVRRTAVGEQRDDENNVLNRLRQGYVVVMAEELSPRDQERYVTLETGKYSGAIGNRDLILMKASVEVIAQRTKNYSDRANKQMRAVEEELQRQNNPTMPIHVDSKSDVTTGRGVQFDK